MALRSSLKNAYTSNKLLCTSHPGCFVIFPQYCKILSSHRQLSHSLMMKRFYTCCQSNFSNASNTSNTSNTSSSSCACSTSANRGQNTYEESNERVTFKFLDKDGSLIDCEAKIGELVSSVAMRYHTTLECACGECMSCSTCHVYLPVELYDTLEFPSEAEDDLLDQAPGLIEDSSRLGCQVRVTKDFQDQVITIPKEHINLLD